MPSGLTLPSIFTAVDKFSGPVNKMSKNAEGSMARMERKFRKVGDTAFSISKKSAVIGASIIAPLALLGNEAVKFEDTLADIGKTTGLEGKKLDALGESIIDLSTTTRSSIADIAKIAEIGGQLGVPEGDLLAFTKAADKFNIALGSDFSGGVEEAVAQVGKIKLLFAETRDLDIATTINKTGSAINELGAIGSGTSANITDFTLRVGAMPDALKPSIQATIALGTFLEEMGVNSQVGASGLSNLMTTAGRNIDDFAKQMDLTKVAAKQLLAEDPSTFVAKFASSFEGLPADELALKLKSLGVNSIEVTKVVGALSSGTERLAELQLASNKAFSEGTSLSKEASKKNETMAAKMAMVKNQMQGIGIQLGQAVLPLLSDLMTAVAPMLKSFGRWVSRNKSLVAGIVKVAAVVGAMALAVSAIAGVVGIATKAIGIYNSILKIQSAATKVITGIQWLWNAAMNANPIGAIIIAVVALTGVVAALAGAFKGQTTAQELANETTRRALDASLDQRVEVTMLFKALRKAKVGTQEYRDTLAKIEEIQPGITEKFNLQTGAIKDQIAAEKALKNSIMDRAMAEAAAEQIKEKTSEALTAMNREATFQEKTNMMLGITTQKEFNKKRSDEAKALMAEADTLADQQINREEKKAKKEVNPAQAAVVAASGGGAAERLKTQNIEVTINGLPEGSTATTTGGGNMASPKLGTTRK